MSPSAPRPTRAASNSSGSCSAEHVDDGAVAEHESQRLHPGGQGREPHPGAVGARRDRPGDRLHRDVAEHLERQTPPGELVAEAPQRDTGLHGDQPARRVDGEDTVVVRQVHQVAVGAGDRRVAVPGADGLDGAALGGGPTDDVDELVLGAWPLPARRHRRLVATEVPPDGAATCCSSRDRRSGRSHGDSGWGCWVVSTPAVVPSPERRHKRPSERRPRVTWTTSDIPDLAGTVAVVTGANGGLGLETADALAAAGAHVVMAARNQEKAALARLDIAGRHPTASLELVELDLGDLASVRDAAAGDPRRARTDRSAGQQRRADGDARVAHRRRLRDAVRRRPPGPLRAHGAPARRPAACPRRLGS